MNTNLLKLFGGHMIANSTMSESAKLQLLNYIEEAEEYQVKAFLLDGEIMKEPKDIVCEEIVDQRFEISGIPELAIDFIQEWDEMLLEDLGISLAAAGIASGLVLGPWFMRQRKIKKARKEQCNKYEGLQRKKCIISAEIDSLKKEKSKLAASISQCSKHPEPRKSKCRKKIQTLVRDYDIRISKERSKIG